MDSQDSQNQQPAQNNGQREYEQPQPQPLQPVQSYDPNQQGQAPAGPTQPYYGAAPHPGLPNEQAAALGENPDKNYLIALLLSYFFGAIGVDRFYLGKVGTGILKLVTLGGAGIWHLVDLLMIAFNKLHAKGDDRPLEGYGHNRHWVKIVAIVMLVFNIVVIVGVLFFVVFSALGGVQQQAHDTARKTDLNMVESDLAAYADSHNGSYPSEQDFNNGTFKPSQPLTELKQSDMQYMAMPMGCGTGTTNCSSFTLSTKLHDGTDYTVQL